MLHKSNIIDILSAVYENSTTTDDWDKLLETLNGIKINNLVQFYVFHQKDLTDSEDIQIVELIIKILQNLYNNSAVMSPISDEDYDLLYELYVDATNNKNIVGDDYKNKNIVNHKYPDLRGTLDKVHFVTIKEKGTDKRKSIEEWVNSIENKLGRPLTGAESEISLFPKFDGISMIFQCDKDGNVMDALTRGNTKNNEAVSVIDLFRGMRFKPVQGWDCEFGVKTEAIVTLDNFEKLKKKYGEFKSPRSAASSIINTKEHDRNLLKYLTLVPLRVQNYNTKEVIVHDDAIVNYPVLYTLCNHYQDMGNMFTNIKDYMENIMRIPIDGIVLYLKDKNLQNTLGRVDAINKYEVAYKFIPKGKKTKLIDVDFSVGSLGSIRPVAKIEPVKMEGNTISNVSLGSVDRFESLHLRKGDEVIIKYDIIPYLYIDETCESSNGEFIETPKYCKYCGERLVYDPILKCNNNDCLSRVVGKIINYIEKMNIESISTATVTDFFEAGILKSIEDLYRLKDYKKKIVAMDGYGEKSFNNIIKGIDKRRTVFDYNLLGSIGITDIGPKNFKKILNIYYLDDLLKIASNADVKKLISIPGIREKTANKIIVGIITNYNLIEFLRKELIIRHDEKTYSMKVVFTKVRDKKFEEYLDSKNIEVCDSFNKSIDMLICDDKYTHSDKFEKANKHGIKIMSITEAKKYFKYEK